MNFLNYRSSDESTIYGLSIWSSSLERSFATTSSKPPSTFGCPNNRRFDSFHQANRNCYTAVFSNAFEDDFIGEMKLSSALGKLSINKSSNTSETVADHSRVNLVNEIIEFAFDNFDRDARLELIVGAVNLLDPILSCKISSLSEQSEPRPIAGAAVPIIAKWLDAQLGDRVWKLMKEELDVELDVDNEQLKAVKTDSILVLGGALCHTGDLTLLDLTLNGLRKGGTAGALSFVDMEKTSALAHYILLSSTLQHTLIGQRSNKVVVASMYFALRVQNVNDWDLRTNYAGSYRAKELLPIYVLFAGLTQPHTGAMLQGCYEDTGQKMVANFVSKWCQRTLEARRPKKAVSAATTHSSSA